MFNSLLTQFHDAAPLPQVNIDDAKSFIELLGSGEQYFQTFSDGDGPYQPYLVAQFHQTFDDAKERLMELNELGAGVFVTINETDGTGRKAENIIAVRAVFLDLDGSPLEPVMRAEIQPHCVVESSPGKYHVYWMVNGLSVEEFKLYQTALIEKFSGDKQVKDVSRVMRIPGFIHQKDEPFLSRILEIHNDLPPYQVEALVEGLSLELGPEEESEQIQVSPGGVYELDRNNFLSNRCYAFIKLGLSGEELFVALNKINTDFCNPPVSESEVRKIVNGKKDIKPEPFSAQYEPVFQTNRCEIFHLQDLLHEKILAPEWVIPYFLPIGLTVLGGKPKAGKSWFALSLCLGVSKGRPVFGQFPCKPVKVLYLCLEDPLSRVQYRAKKLLQQEDISRNFLFSTQWTRFASPREKNPHEDGLAKLKETIINQRDLKLIVIDTWQKIRPTKYGKQNDYESDYQHLQQIQEMAMHYHIGIVIVHHARKDSLSEEKQDVLLGSTAIAGVCDLIWILERKAPATEGVLTPRGRDIENEEPISFTLNDGQWEYAGIEKEIVRNKNEAKIIEILIENNKMMTFTELMEVSGLARSSTHRALESLMKSDRVQYHEGMKKYSLSVKDS